MEIYQINHNNIIGQRFGMLTVLEEADPAKDSRGHTLYRYKCLCDCGREKIINFHNLKSGHMNSCGCTHFPKMLHKDLSGQRFHMLTVISEAEPYIRKRGTKVSRWNCLCDCGNHTTVLHTNLYTTISCGCIKRAGRYPKNPNLTGNRYGSLTVLSPADPVFKSKRTGKRRTWLCRCECGNEVIKREDNLLSGHTRSCGCMQGHSIKGQKFGMLTVVSREPSNSSIHYWKCSCECGKEIVASFDDLFWGSVTSCGCDKKLQREDLTGKTFGKLTALREVASIPTKSGRLRAWLCRCECGREVVVRHSNLTRKVTRSCGCLRKEKAKKRGRDV